MKRKLGIRMGDPLFKIKDIVRKYKVHVFSGNFSLYGDMSSRVMETLKILAPSLEIYSIDEAFLDLKFLPCGRSIGQDSPIRKQA